MPCFRPLRAWYPDPARDQGPQLVFKENGMQEIEIPCGRCAGCRLARSREWAVRCAHEASLYQDNTFLTLTYSTEHLPTGGTLYGPHLTQFMKNLRKKNPETKIRFFAGGEYGKDFNQPTALGRPHYHLLLFNFRPGDLFPVGERSGFTIYGSDTIERIWGKGYITAGSVTFASAQYVAKYCMKKINGPQQEEHYRKVDIETGEEYAVRAEFCRASNQPGIGKPWLDRYTSDIFKGYVTIEGKRHPVPSYYFDKLAEEQPWRAEEISIARQEAAQWIDDEQLQLRADKHARRSRKDELEGIQRLRR